MSTDFVKEGGRPGKGRRVLDRGGVTVHLSNPTHSPLPVTPGQQGDCRNSPGTGSWGGKFLPQSVESFAVGVEKVLESGSESCPRALTDQRQETGKVWKLGFLRAVYERRGKGTRKPKPLPLTVRKIPLFPEDRVSDAVLSAPTRPLQRVRAV